MAKFRRLTEAEIDNLSDEEFDAYLDWKDSIKNQNSRKTLVPLFMMQILRDHSNRLRHLTQNEIIAYLEEYPYNISIERKAVGRTLRVLEDEGMGVHCDKRTGSWFEVDSFNKAS